MVRFISLYWKMIVVAWIFSVLPIQALFRFASLRSSSTWSPNSGRYTGNLESEVTILKFGFVLLLQGPRLWFLFLSFSSFLWFVLLGCQRISLSLRRIVCRLRVLFYADHQCTKLVLIRIMFLLTSFVCFCDLVSKILSFFVVRSIEGSFMCIFFVRSKCLIIRVLEHASLIKYTFPI